MKFSDIFFIFLCPLSCFRPTNIFASPNYTAIFSFGDSYADTGNLGIIEGPDSKDALSVFPPYGVTYFHSPNGRFSDGRLILDFVAEEFNLPFVNPYWKYNDSFIQGANFAVSGAMTLDYEFYAENNLTKFQLLNTSLNEQLSWFQQLKPSLCTTQKRCKDYFARSLFFLGEFGVNDYAYMKMSEMSLEEVRGFVPMVIETISKAAEFLIENGAVTIVIPGQIPSGCLPVSLAQNTGRPKSDYDPETGCLEELNELSVYHNSKLLEAINQLRAKNRHVKLIYADYYQPLIDFIKSPELYGFSETPLKVCCGKGDNQYNYNQSQFCSMSNVGYCKNVSSFLNWDGAHLTEAAYRHIATGWLKGSYAKPPILTPESSLMRFFSS